MDRYVMKAKGDKQIFFRVFGIVIVILLINLGGFLYSDFLVRNGGNRGFTGFSISELVSNPGSKVDLVPKVFFVAQWSILALLLIFTALKDSKVRMNSKVLKNVKINPSKQHTDLDKFYDLLLDKKQLRAVDVSRLFNVNKDIVLDWFKILESGDLAIIDYPMFGGPVIKIEEKPSEEGDKGDKIVEGKSSIKNKKEDNAKDVKNEKKDKVSGDKKSKVSEGKKVMTNEPSKPRIVEDKKKLKKNSKDKKKSSKNKKK
jgi:hypothetical protein